MTNDVDPRREVNVGRAAALAGAGIALLATAVLHTFATWFPFPPIAVADAVIELTPGPIATRSIELLGHLAQPLLVLATTAAFLGLAAVLGRLLPRLPRARPRRAPPGAPPPPPPPPPAPPGRRRRR